MSRLQIRRVSARSSTGFTPDSLQVLMRDANTPPEQTMSRQVQTVGDKLQSVAKILGGRGCVLSPKPPQRKYFERVEWANEAAKEADRQP